MNFDLMLKQFCLQTWMPPIFMSSGEICAALIVETGKQWFAARHFKLISFKLGIGVFTAEDQERQIRAKNTGSFLTNC